MQADPSDAAPRTPAAWAVLLAVAAVATLPHASLVAANVGQGLDLGTVARWWLVTLVVAVAVVGAVARVAPRWTGRAGVVVAVATWLAFHHPVLTGLRARLDLPLSDLAWWVVASLALLLLATWLGRHAAVQRFVVVVAPLLLLAPLLQVLTGGSAPPPAAAAGDGSFATFEQRPDVVWFVLDGLAGVPWLRDEAGVDTGPFVAALEEDGFEVVEDARTNYPFTHLAVTSALELELVYDGVEEPPVGPYLPALQGDNRVVDTFRANGYGHVHAYPGFWTGSRCGGREDVCLGANGTMTDTEAALLARTPLTELVDPRAKERIATANDPLAVVDAVLEAGAPDPTFAFVHLMNPHPPYLRDADCDLRQVPLDFAAWGEGVEYRDAVTCLFERLEAAVDRLLAADPDTVVVITGDHGPRLGLSAATEGEVLLGEEMHLSAFHAMRLPPVCDDLDVPQDMTLVNTFRVVFACLSGEPLDLVEDRLNPIRRDYD